MTLQTLIWIDFKVIEAIKYVWYEYIFDSVSPFLLHSQVGSLDLVLLRHILHAEALSREIIVLLSILRLLHHMVRTVLICRLILSLSNNIEI